MDKELLFQSSDLGEEKQRDVEVSARPESTRRVTAI